MSDSVHTPPDGLTQADLPSMPLVTFDRARNLLHTGNGQLLDLVSVRVQGEGFESSGAVFAAVYRKNWTSQSFEAALKSLQAARLDGTDRLPLVVLPYLNEEKLAVLAEQQVSGLDLCGNALLIVPGKLLVQRSGQPNRFKAERGLRSPYTGKASLVGRALLIQPQFETANDLLAFIRTRGGGLSQALLSRTLKALTEDLVVSNEKSKGLSVLQPGKLLDRLVDGWQGRTGGLVQRERLLLWRGKVSLPPGQLMAALTDRARQTGQRFTATGLVTSAQHTNLSSGGERSAYVDSVGNLLANLDAQETRRFPNLELWRAPDDAVYFDTTTEDGVIWASPLQTYLEMATGEARTRQAAEPLRQVLLEKVEEKLAVFRARGHT